jgi:hypothetical protein
MPRVYYNEEKIYGTAVETAVINMKNISALIENKNNAPLWKMPVNRKIFQHIDIETVSQFYTDTGEGKTVYLPKNIEFWDMDDFVFPSVFYFIALIGDKLEIRYVNGGEEVKWFNIPDLHKELNDANIIKKMELTIEAALAYIEKYKEPEKKKVKVKGIKLNKDYVEEFLAVLGMKKQYAGEIVEMAYSPTDYFDKNADKLRKYEILDASKNMYLLYLSELLEKKKIVRTVDWNMECEDVIYNFEKLTKIKIESIDAKKYSDETAGKILSDISKELESKYNKKIFCIDTDSDSYSFGIMENELLLKLIQAGKKAKIKIYEPEKKMKIINRVLQALHITGLFTLRR